MITNCEKIFNRKNKLIFSAASDKSKQEIMNSIKELKMEEIQLKIFLLGDKYQLPPVKEPKSKSFDIPHIGIELMHVWRTENEDMNQINAFCRHAIEADYSVQKLLLKFLKTFKHSNYIKFLKSKEQFKNEYIQILENNNIESSENEQNECCIICRKNKTVDDYNLSIQKKIRENKRLSRREIEFKYILKGETFQFDQTFYNEGIRYFQFERYVCTNVIKEEYRIFNLNLKGYLYYFMDKAKYVSFFCCDKQSAKKLKVVSTRIEDVFKKWNELINDTLKEIKKIRNEANECDEITLFENVSDDIHHDIIEICEEYNITKPEYVCNFPATRNSLESYLKTFKKKIWKEEQYVSAKISHGHAITSYKCQGETLNHVFVDLDDIISSIWNRSECLRHIYTVISRAQNFVTIHTKTKSIKSQKTKPIVNFI